MSLRHRPGLCALVGGLALIGAGSARAHSFSDGGAYDQFIEGIVIPWAESPSLLLLLGTGAMVGLWRGGSIGRLFPFMVSGVAAGLVVWSLLPEPIDPASVSWLLLAASIGMACLAIAAQPWPWWLSAALACIATALCTAYPFLDHSRNDIPLATVAGCITGIFLCILVVNNVITLVRERWTQTWVTVGFQVASSWLCAIAILLLAFTLRS